ncbi:hypothetical protein AAVH_12989 [Aphelenchoides avenae]|nr:hypothetical protein AAVH_12989 [Aphelenchus avenae]
MLIGVGSTSNMCSTAAHIGFNMSRSTTFRRSTLSPYWASLELFMLGHQCNINLDAAVTLGKDDFLGSRQVPFGVISHFDGAWDPSWASDGILGLLGPDSPFSGRPGTAKALAKKNGNAVVAWYHNGAALGSYRVDSAVGTGVFDYFASVLLRVPQMVFDNFVEEIKAEEYLGTGIYYVNCGSASKLPNLTVTLEGLAQPLAFPYNAYIDLAPNKRNGKCEVRLRRWDSGDRFWTFGNRLWENYCVALNYHTGLVGFSLLRAKT